MTGFKVSPPPPGTVVTLRRISWIQRTVRQEWMAKNADGDNVREYGPTYGATALEWERAVD